DALPAPKWRRKKTLRASTQSLLQHLRHEVWADALHFSGFVPTPSGNAKPQKLEKGLGHALFYAIG
ncbi:MAG: hypothetical protein PHO14_10410, partial [Kiritimatiellae bacterium]|nr:hypothetical protein [Kiritimatiellia bacterium]MDD4342625.1 hypothetical protein [Kiritimatiellia bacterium]